MKSQEKQYRDLRNVDDEALLSEIISTGGKLGILAGSGRFPLIVAREAKARGIDSYVVAHRGETTQELEEEVKLLQWVKLGELGKLISFFLEHQIRYLVLAGGISRVRAFGVKLDLRGAALLARIRSFKDDKIMRGIAAELAKEEIEVVPCTLFLKEALAPEGLIASREPSKEELQDIQIGKDAIAAMRGQHIGQCVVVREGVVVAVEAVEGTDAAILRGGELGGKGTTVVKFAKPDQDMRFDVPTVGPKTIETMVQTGARVLALEAGRCVILDKEDTLRLAKKHKIAIMGCSAI